MFWRSTSPAHKKKSSNYYAPITEFSSKIFFLSEAVSQKSTSNYSLRWTPLLLNLSKESMVGKPSIRQMHNPLLEFYFRILCTSNARNLLLLILFFPIDISHNKTVLFFLCVLYQDCFVTVCSQTNLTYLRMVLTEGTCYHSTTWAHPAMNQGCCCRKPLQDSLVILLLSYYLSLLDKEKINWTKILQLKV